MKKTLPLLLAAATVPSAGKSQDLSDANAEIFLHPVEERLDSLLFENTMYRPYEMSEPANVRLTEQDYREVAEALGVEVAAIKAVVDIETGMTHQGFWAPGKPLINFDLSIYRSRARRHGVNLDNVKRKSPEVFAAPNIRKYGSRHAAQQARLDAARSHHEESALEGTFWGMFQIGGFNYDKCGTATVQEFVEKMARSERDQLELFAEFCKTNNLVRFMKAKDWAGFSLRYNGPSYKQRGYDTKMSAAYRRHKAKESK